MILSSGDLVRVRKINDNEFCIRDIHYRLRSAFVIKSIVSKRKDTSSFQWQRVKLVLLKRLIYRLLLERQ